ncbi:type IX secretion system membrane protein PorP/SprF [Tenacibaculum sp. 1B UA]|uniref:type IX secretion system membrane protein PorP/SprF n=1 Tax=Tenacibaculum sp. 1B UA TaxID=2922252 RepID=UPI002A2463FC|nr:type IX secretion system membrane protein PorP/SprF [Tenacibaculum sp. 1B UA]MDX8554412.1 type IX secretion system membrane protein PorP/SprF [Tenacibaculum sp. 1B UA]
MPKLKTLYTGIMTSEDDLDISVPVYGYYGYRFFTNRFEEVMIKPSIFFKYEGGAPLQVDLNMAVNYKNKLEIGTGYRRSSSINFLAGIYAIKNFKFVYFYNVGFNTSVLGNNHGVVLSYTFDKKRRN